MNLENFGDVIILATVLIILSIVYLIWFISENKKVSKFFRKILDFFVDHFTWG